LARNDKITYMTTMPIRSFFGSSAPRGKSLRRCEVSHKFILVVLTAMLVVSVLLVGVHGTVSASPNMGTGIGQYICAMNDKGVVIECGYVQAVKWGMRKINGHWYLAIDVFSKTPPPTPRPTTNPRWTPTPIPPSADNGWTPKYYQGVQPQWFDRAQPDPRNHW